MTYSGQNKHVIRSRAVLLALAAAAAGAGCGASERSGLRAVPAPRAEKAPAEASACARGVFRRLGSNRVAYAAVVRRAAVAYRRPARAPIERFGRLNQNGVPTVFGVLGAVLDARCEPRWYRVQLPLRPNGLTGYVRADAVRVERVSTRIVVDLSERRVELLRDGRPVLRTVAAVGSPETPTPTGRFYVNQRLIPTDPSGPYGPAALGVSAYSEVLTDWAQGGPVAIHGTNRPSSIGEPASHGCIRVRNPVLRRLFEATPAGTPVVINP